MNVDRYPPIPLECSNVADETGITPRSIILYIKCAIFIYKSYLCTSVRIYSWAHYISADCGVGRGWGGLTGVKFGLKMLSHIDQQKILLVPLK